MTIHWATIKLDKNDCMILLTSNKALPHIVD